MSEPSFAPLWRHIRPDAQDWSDDQMETLILRDILNKAQKGIVPKDKPGKPKEKNYEQAKKA